ncbi:hypothetical protein RSOLAG1IB_10613 [Rhizoctonia solani AG-1 IB]|uniref:Uncharacterized protein n=1 Tax=Thanatephorus cucumeris (strain AG1-IB / isolate 7/3/14) TaxID=1108050 RepID=A0A0B7FYE0_THACB|nr:hypothetical protein RSOLAG1IB_10613 [Rhizoctonia solani AG-1 IB]
MLGELQAASELLQVAIDRYLNACRTIRESYLETKILRDVPRELLNKIEDELPRISSCNTKILQAKSAISQTRNCSSQAVPIHTLPTEVLTRIFHMVVAAQWCNISGYRKKIQEEEVSGSYPDQPVVISHVCSFWRRIIISSSSLWSHLDFSFPDIANDPLSISRLETSINRSGQSLLEVHIDASDHFDYITTTGEMTNFMTLNGPRTRSLELEVGMHKGTISLEFCHSILTSCFTRCAPGTLRQLSIIKRGEYNHYQAIEPANHMRVHQPILLAASEQYLEDLWLHIDVLRLRGLYPIWSSKIYHRLVELRLPLIQGGMMSESQLVSILKSSPQLRILEFGITVTSPGSTNASKNPVPLADLEVLITGTWGKPDLSSFLRLIAPGPKPLCVSIVNPKVGDFSRVDKEAPPPPSLFDDDIKKFFARSNITRVGLAAIDKYAEFMEVLDLVPRIHTLGLTDWFCEESDEVLKASATPIAIDTLYLLNHCRMEWVFLKHIIKTFHVKAIIIWGDHGVESGLMPIEREPFERELQKHCSIVEFRSSDEPNPFEGHEWY